jgi:DNA polymerase I-like protein with 3'-5' exonuclease and polymerase domains
VWQIGKTKFTFHLLNPFNHANIHHKQSERKEPIMATQANYTAELTAKIIDQYQNGTDVAEIAASIDKSVRSVRSKLVREGVYVAQPKVKSQKVQGPTKKELLRDLEGTGFDVSGFEGATKEAITRLIAMVN